MIQPVPSAVAEAGPGCRAPGPGALLVAALVPWALATAAHAQESVTRDYHLALGAPLNVESGVGTVLGLSSLGFDQVNHLIETGVPSGAPRVLARVANLAVVQLWGGGLLAGTFVHEYLGHSLRAREAGLPLDLELNFPGFGGDYRFPVTYETPALDRQLVVAGGLEATALIAHRSIADLYADGRAGSYVGLYMLSAKVIEGTFSVLGDIDPFLADPDAYYADNRRLRRNPVPNDPLAYLLALTERYGYYDGLVEDGETWVARRADMTEYTRPAFVADQRNRIRRAFLVSALDPALLYFVSGTVAYLASGSTFLRPLMPRIGPVSFMPSTRAVLGELGAESYYDVIARVEGGPAALAYYRSGGNLHDRLRGAGLELHGVELGGHEGSFRADYWRDGRAGEHRFHLSVGSTVPVESSGRTALTAEIGYKTRGLLMGKPIGAGLYGYLGTRLSLRYDR